MTRYLGVLLLTLIMIANSARALPCLDCFQSHSTEQASQLSANYLTLDDGFHENSLILYPNTKHTDSDTHCNSCSFHCSKCSTPPTVLSALSLSPSSSERLDFKELLRFFLWHSELLRPPQFA